MRWDVVIEAVRKALKADAALTSALGSGTIEPMESNVERRVPSIRYTLVTDFDEEVLNPIMLQIDYWALSRAKAVTIEGRIEAVLKKPLGTSFALTGIGETVRMGCELIERRDASDPQPGVVHRQLDFRFTPVRADADAGLFV